MTTAPDVRMRALSNYLILPLPGGTALRQRPQSPPWRPRSCPGYASYSQAPNLQI